jgi:hypothetical protein
MLSGNFWRDLFTAGGFQTRHYLEVFRDKDARDQLLLGARSTTSPSSGTASSPRIVAALTLLGCLVPARPPLRFDPLVALRRE